MPDIYRDTVSNGQGGLFVSYWLGTRGALVRSPLLFGHFPKCICYSVSVAEKVSNTLWVFFSQRVASTLWVQLKMVSNVFPKCLCINLGFPLHSPESQMYIRIKNQRHDRKM
jgi:hypothetical protein